MSLLIFPLIFPRQACSDELRIPSMVILGLNIGKKTTTTNNNKNKTKQKQQFNNVPLSHAGSETFC